MTQAAQARLCLRCGFFCRAVLPSSSGVGGIENCDLVLRKGDTSRVVTPAVVRLMELESNGSCLGGDGGQFDEPLCGGELTVFQPEALQLQQTPELLDDPALLVPMDDAPSSGGVGNVMGGEQPPVQGLGILRRMRFEEFDQSDRHAHRQMGMCLPLGRRSSSCPNRRFSIAERSGRPARYQVRRSWYRRPQSPCSLRTDGGRPPGSDPAWRARSDGN